MNKIKIIIGSVLAVFVIVPVILWLVVQQTTVKTGIQFIVIPDDITATINHTKYKVDYETTIKIKPGDYSVKLAHDNFSAQTEKVTVTSNHISKVFVSLAPTNDVGRKLINTDLAHTRSEEIEGHNSSNALKNSEAQYPFVKKLPVAGKYFYATPCHGRYNNQPFGICIDLFMNNDFYRNQAKTELTDNGIDITDIPLYFYQS